MSREACRVLVVDDEAGIRRIFVIALENYGFLVDCAESAVAALDLLERRTYDVIVSDVHMPGSSGLDFLGVARARGVRTPVIVMSGRPSVEGRARAFEMGAIHYAIKPVMPSELRRLIEGALPPNTSAFGRRPTGRLSGSPWRP